MPIDIEVYLDDQGLPACSPDPVVVRIKGATVLRWKIRNGQPISAITAITGLPVAVFNPPPQAQGGGQVWVSTDNAANSNNGTYKYDIAVRKTDGAVVSQDPEVTNNVDP
jgi:hypothetical protein